MASMRSTDMLDLPAVATSAPWQRPWHEFTNDINTLPRCRGSQGKEVIIEKWKGSTNHGGEQGNRAIPYLGCRNTLTTSTPWHRVDIATLLGAKAASQPWRLGTLAHGHAPCLSAFHPSNAWAAIAMAHCGMTLKSVPADNRLATRFSNPPWPAPKLFRRKARTPETSTDQNTDRGERRTRDTFRSIHAISIIGSDPTNIVTIQTSIVLPRDGQSLQSIVAERAVSLKRDRVLPRGRAERGAPTATLHSLKSNPESKRHPR